ncbi:DNA topoisomerase (ATP-hydrolyzing) [Alkalinema sp. FACHB-956]|uniref:DNA gyrase/topoisomerase IV subunit A n=1 Tax=Alkalinema sp. FACHB-956 TaxID=2692768 RepID=UPI0016862CEF|nr:DNA topoisomerase (ATP-hydrolyzing) [Alkalinema sp. FACHB-956]MBD2328176.1 DNA topoisomerase 4 subunit A [Alkalinema sp. FACHB-956]
MAKQLDILQTGQVISTALHTEMQQSYLEYAMSVIVGRALPDVRDGLKPVHRRILYAMHELGLTPDRPFRKCARVVGDVLGKYHPHGDQAVYDALVRMVQDFSSRYPLLAGHGNFGSVDNDPPAAMRYTETRLSPISNESMLTEIGDSTVEFIGNFDNSQQEPTVLPAQLPFLLLNGSSGIAVGMATNIPPHNLGEVVDGLIALIDNPNLADEKLLEIIPGPDFPTGGEIVGTEGIREAYLTGRGSIPIRGVTDIEEIHVGKGKHRRSAIVITELPYQVNKASLIEKIAELVNGGKLEGISDIRDESDREGIRVVIELKRDTNPNHILQALYKQTALQSNFGTIMLALSQAQPRQMTLRELLQEFLTFREETLTRRYGHELTQHENRIHLVEGWLEALANLDDVIDILRNAPDGTSAKVELQNQFDFSDRQADAILGMPLRRLTGLEHQNLQTEFEELTTKIADLKKLLSDRRELLKALKKELRHLKKQFGDARKTRILDLGASPTAPLESSKPLAKRASALPKNADATEAAVSAPKAEKGRKASPKPAIEEVELFAVEDDQETVIELTQKGYIRRVSPKTYQRQQRKTEDLDKPVLEELDDVVIQTEFTTTAETLVVLTRSGKAFPLSVRDIPQAAARTKGVPLVTLLPANAGVGADTRAIVSTFFLPEDLDSQALLLLTAQGKMKRIALTEFQDMTNRGLIATKLKDDDSVLLAGFVEEGDQVVVCTSLGRVVRIEVNEETFPIANRTSVGTQVTKLLKLERFVGWAIAGYEDDFLMVSEQGYAKRMTVGALKLCAPGELGQNVFQFTNKSDVLMGMTVAFPGTHTLALMSDTCVAKLPVEAVLLGTRMDKGEKPFKIAKGEKVTDLILPIVPYGEGEDEF